MTVQVIGDAVENIVGNGENTGYQHFLLVQQCFQMASSLVSLKLGMYGKGLNDPGNKAFENVAGKKKILVTSILSFSHNLIILSKANLII